MQRQSLGSPLSKLHCNGGGAKSDLSVLKHAPSPSSSADFCQQDDDKASKSHRLSLSSPSPPRPEKFVHLIPLLTVICFLILYLCSHSPSHSDLAQFHGFKRIPKHTDSAEIKVDVTQLIVPKRGNIMAIQSLRNLREIEKLHPSKSRTPRKLADF